GKKIDVSDRSRNLDVSVDEAVGGSRVGTSIEEVPESVEILHVDLSPEIMGLHEIQLDRIPRLGINVQPSAVLAREDGARVVAIDALLRQFRIPEGWDDGPWIHRVEGLRAHAARRGDERAVAIDERRPVVADHGGYLARPEARVDELRLGPLHARRRIVPELALADEREEGRVGPFGLERLYDVLAGPEVQNARGVDAEHVDRALHEPVVDVCRAADFLLRLRLGDEGWP